MSTINIRVNAKKIVTVFIFFFAVNGYAQAVDSESSVQANTNVEKEIQKVTWGGFVDTYYAYDLNEPPLRDRSFTTQPARNNEFNINMVYIDGKLNADKVHGRIALQAGTSVQSNYSSEPGIGSVSGSDLSRHIQEAYAGYRIGENTWIDAGIMFSHIGLESFLSKDNLTYTRSLVADYSPYYQTGIRLTTKFSEKLSAQILLLNGWQNISESNDGKAGGTQLSYAFTPNISLTYNTFFGDEGTFRHFHDLVFKMSFAKRWIVGAQADLGFQNQSTGYAHWYGFTAMSKFQITDAIGVVGRVERYSDPEQIIIVTGLPVAFEAWGGSMGMDMELYKNLFWRSEFRAIWSSNPVYPDDSGLKGHDYVLVSALTAEF